VEHTEKTAARGITFGLTALAMLAFAGNSLLTRAALLQTQTAPGCFLAVRIGSGALMLWLLLSLRRSSSARRPGGDWYSALALFAYGAGFSFAYLSLSAATGALLLFGAVQVTMIGYGLWRGEPLRGMRLAGFLLASLGLIALLLPGLARPPLLGAVLMLLAGLAWGVYSLRGRGALDPLAATTGNFMRAAPLALLVGLGALWPWPFVALDTAASYVPPPLLDGAGFAYALLSGALASGMGYAIWYSALRGLRPAEAATVQLSVPVIAAAGGALLLGEPLSLRLFVCALAILGGIALVLLAARPAAGRSRN
jgi:drug/metabolite transporter (DMT)-like permease